MSNTVASIVQKHIEGRPGYSLVPAAFGKPGQQAHVWVECPSWCKDDHVKDWNQHAVDLDHWGPCIVGWDVDSIHQPGERLLSLDARLHSDPAATDPKLSGAHVLMDDETTQVYLTPDMAEKTADELIAFAAHIRHLARQAREFNDRAAGQTRRSQADEALRRVRADKWRSLSGEDIASLPIVRLLKAFGVTVVEDDIAGAELLGQPGHMELRVGRATRQQLRDSEARRLIAEYVAGARRA